MDLAQFYLVPVQHGWKSKAIALGSFLVPAVSFAPKASEGENKATKTWMHFNQRAN